jgi:hypothetical protein
VPLQPLEHLSITKWGAKLIILGVRRNIISTGFTGLWMKRDYAPVKDLGHFKVQNANFFYRTFGQKDPYYL